MLPVPCPVSSYLGRPRPREGKERAFKAKETLGPLPGDLLPTRKQEWQITNTLSTTYTCTPSPTEADAHARGPAGTYLVFSVLNARTPAPLGAAWHPPTPALGREALPVSPGLAQQSVAPWRGRGGPPHPGGSGARRPGRLRSRPGNIWTELGGARAQGELGLAAREAGGGAEARGGARWPL